jgi:hypothetical protein
MNIQQKIGFKQATLLALSALAVALSLPQPSRAATTITSLVYYHVAVPNCEDVVNGSPCSPVGVTQSGAIDNPFLNNTATKEIDLGLGRYFTFGNPWPGTDFMVAGDSISVALTLSNGQVLSQTTVVPDLAVAGTTLFDFGAISIATTGVTSADRMSFGSPPGAFAGDGLADYVLQLNYVPEPAVWALMLTGFGGVGGVLRRRRRSRIPAFTRMSA